MFVVCTHPDNELEAFVDEVPPMPTETEAITQHQRDRARCKTGDLDPFGAGKKAVAQLAEIPTSSASNAAPQPATKPHATRKRRTTDSDDRMAVSSPVRRLRVADDRSVDVGDGLHRSPGTRKLVRSRDTFLEEFLRDCDQREPDKSIIQRNGPVQTHSILHELEILRQRVEAGVVYTWFGLQT